MPRLKCLVDLEEELGFDFYDKEWKILEPNNKFFGSTLSLGQIAQKLAILLMIVYLALMILNIPLVQKDCNNSEIPNIIYHLEI